MYAINCVNKLYDIIIKTFMKSSPFQSDQGFLLDFKHTGTRVDGDPNYPFEAALRLGVPISERGLLMGTEQYMPSAQSALLRAKVQPSGMYTVRTSSLPVEQEAERQSMGVLPQTSRIIGALSRPPPVLVEPKAGIAAELDETFSMPYMNKRESKKDAAGSRAFGTVQEQTKEVRQGLAEAGARYGTSFVPQSSFYGLPDPGNQSNRTSHTSYNLDVRYRTPSEVLESSDRHATHNGGIITQPGPSIPINASTMATMQPPHMQGTYGTWSMSEHEVGQGYHQQHPVNNEYGGYKVHAYYPSGAIQTSPNYKSPYAPGNNTEIQNILQNPIDIYRREQQHNVVRGENSAVYNHNNNTYEKKNHPYMR